MRSFATDLIDLNGKEILVTGGTGSFGRQFISTVLKNFSPKRVVIFTRDELKQYEMQQELPPSRHPALRYFIGDVRDEARLEMAMRGIDIVIHAAALKQVSMAEYNPFECIRTNVHGAENVVNAAIKCGVKKVIALSTDKAAAPINLYGASKLASDKIFIAGNNLSGKAEARFSVVRYGNVVGSRGSIVPLFERMLSEGKHELPITDYRMTRFWITLQQGVDFVLSCLKMMQGAEVFIPKIPSMKIVDLAEAMAPGISLREIGIRPGEKLHEVMVTEDDARTTVEYPDRYIIEPAFASWERKSFLKSGAKPVLEGFRYASDTNDEWLHSENLKQILKSSR